MAWGGWGWGRRDEPDHHLRPTGRPQRDRSKNKAQRRARRVNR